MKDKRKYWIIPLLMIWILGCEEMEDNYQQYLSNRIYSPKVIDLTAEVGYKTALLKWTNPAGNIAKTIEIKYDDVVINTSELLSRYQLNELELKGYNIAVFTIDQHGNRSVPAHIYVFPSGEEN
ncbi:protein of unknown function [Saccharicrinis carchari]|uniref:Fibronectin type-III domain-containing protein n=1 Tax=Saccharicrinis carchari TaxID=1168039 RepID=A0A521EJA7_SACCC|nr:DUF4998 domain-containing protein [Saccharicrinis carchari]SMO83996.1 protein of unknown function [Saccharicrinis carchari]